MKYEEGDDPHKDEELITFIEEDEPLSPETTNMELVPTFQLRSTMLSAAVEAMEKEEDEEYSSNEHAAAIAKEIPKDLEVDFHMVDLGVLYDRFNSDGNNGITMQLAAKRFQADGPNMLSARNYGYIWKVINYFFGGLAVMLWPASVLSLVSYGFDRDISNIGLAIILVLVIFVQGGFSMYQDWSTSKVMNSIKKMLPQSCSVIRDGMEMRINTSDLVVGDVVKIECGDRIPVDMRLLECNQLKVDNSILTGESEPISCTTQYTDVNYMETKNLVFMGANAVEGAAKGLVVATGNRTMMGKISTLTATTTKGTSTLRKQANRIVLTVAVLGIISVIILILFWATVLRRYTPGFMTPSGLITNCIGLLVAFVPEGFVMSLTITLTVIADRMYRQNVLVKSLPTVETLGAIDVIASDKTGTLTQNKMKVINLFFGEKMYHANDCFTLYENGETTITELIKMMALCNRARYDTSSQLPLEQRPILGDASDSAFFTFAEQFLKVGNIRLQCPKLAEIPFNSKNKWMLSIIKESNNSCTLFMKGASEIIVKRCTTFIDTNGNEIPFTPEATSIIFKNIEDLCNEGKRVLGFARLKLDPLRYPTTYAFNTEDRNFPTEGLCLIGLVGLFDPPRTDVEEAILKCKGAGINVMMVTGDHHTTAAAIAKMVGIITKDHLFMPIHLTAETQAVEMLTQDPQQLAPLVIRGEHVPKFDKEQWNYVLAHDEIVFARTTPEHKLMIVKECQKRKHIVAATGDGVNDAPALKQANVGVAMGEGSEVAKEAADIVLMDNRFSSVTIGIQYGRLVFDNLRKVVIYLMTAGNYAEFVPVLIHCFLGVPLPLSSFLMIVICVATDMGPSLSLIWEQPEGNLMKRQPNIKTGATLFGVGTLLHVFLFLGNIEAFGGMFMFFFYLWREGDINPYDLFFRYDHWGDGFLGISKAALDEYLYGAQTCYFVAIVMIQFGNLLATRTLSLSIFEQFPLFKESTKNNTLILGMMSAASIAIFVVYLPFFNYFFKTRKLSYIYWLMPMVFGLALLALDELRKLILRLCGCIKTRVLRSKKETRK